MRDIYFLGETSSGYLGIGQAALDVILQHTFVDCAFLLKEVPRNSREFQTSFAAGLRRSDFNPTLRMPEVPDFVFTTSRSKDACDVADALRTYAGVPYLLWSFDATSGNALVIGNRSESNINRAWEVEDREIVETALAVVLSATERGAYSSTPETAMSGVFPLGGNLQFPTTNIAENELRYRIQKGGRVLGVVAVARTDSETGKIDYALYVLGDWSAIYCKLRTARGKGDRTYNDLDRLVGFVRELAGNDVPIVTLPAGAVTLCHFPGIAKEDTSGVSGSLQDRVSSVITK